MLLFVKIFQANFLLLHPLETGKKRSKKGTIGMNWGSAFKGLIYAFELKQLIKFAPC